jgi:multicomponent Na+:H+ antiporter subunit E
MTLSLRPLAVRLVTLAWLVLVWVALWGDISVGTAAGGLLIGLIALRGVAGGGGAAGHVRVRPLAALRFARVFAVMLVQSNLSVLRLTLAVRHPLRSLVLAVRLPPAPPAVASIVANAVTLTPGTLSLDLTVAADESALLLVHALDAPDAEEVRADVLRLHTLASAAVQRRQDTTELARKGRPA